MGDLCVVVFRFLVSYWHAAFCCFGTGLDIIVGTMLGIVVWFDFHPKICTGVSELGAKAEMASLPILPIEGDCRPTSDSPNF